MVTLTSASLSEHQRRALDRLLELLDAEYGADLHAVWLYGSRARGDAWEGSDVDLMVIASGGDAEEERIRELAREAAAPRASTTSGSRSSRGIPPGSPSGAQAGRSCCRRSIATRSC
jgi:predicted nucleotidyltransferase